MELFLVASILYNTLLVLHSTFNNFTNYLILWALLNIIVSHIELS
jgi:hypothetical protein